MYLREKTCRSLHSRQFKVCWQEAGWRLLEILLEKYVILVYKQQ
jgi:hypothetical protein